MTISNSLQFPGVTYNKQRNRWIVRQTINGKQSAPSKRFLMAQKATGNLPHYKLGRRVFYDPSAVLNHITNSGKEVAQ